ncbi:hypothetical protein SARC_09858 [Sphaeroforma arctica JP610]|uniref:Uncharacterized protein n=1 Tax=Sphaeroforma arctica JP610 TaxID=667725 RepID=A0A0L0FNY8_9EUKA|nr:hypothetical protein SARC_09858 [Sphaeroforma arctica JP610]KNC77688.1 hypothetical protein SARC_09858 [Sphaeroforma arctica JP610]|eukprot:XP_014151590.1 hypothetical protein SARC_09858 [Sphaeroforma arctica JP610]
MSIASASPKCMAQVHVHCRRFWVQRCVASHAALVQGPVLSGYTKDRASGDAYRATPNPFTAGAVCARSSHAPKQLSITTRPNALEPYGKEEVACARDSHGLSHTQV